MSLFNERIEVKSTTGGHPAMFAWRGRVYRVRRIVDSWSSSPQTSSPQAPKPDTSGFHLVRVATESDHGEHGIADIACDPTTNGWTLRRQWG